jgi:hypothetical protein
MDAPNEAGRSILPPRSCFLVKSGADIDLRPATFPSIGPQSIIDAERALIITRRGGVGGVAGRG